MLTVPDKSYVEENRNNLHSEINRQNALMRSDPEQSELLAMFEEAFNRTPKYDEFGKKNLLKLLRQHVRLGKSDLSNTAQVTYKISMDIDHADIGSHIRVGRGNDMAGGRTKGRFC